MRVMLLCAAAAAVCMPAFAAEKANPEEIIQKFAAKEAEFREARNNYTVTLTVNGSISTSGTVTCNPRKCQ